MYVLILPNKHQPWHNYRVINFSEGGELMTNGKKRKIEVSTVAEAEFYADHGFDDILYGTPIIERRITK